MKEILYIALSAESTIIAASLLDLYWNLNYFESLLSKIKDQASCTLMNFAYDK